MVDALVDAEVERRADQGEGIEGERDICSPNMMIGMCVVARLTERVYSLSS